MASLQARIFDRLVRRLQLLGGDGADIFTLRRRIERTAPRVLPLPGGAVLLSPVTDLEMSGASHANRRALDPVFGGTDLRLFITAYAGAHDPREPYLSPLLADLHGLPPLLIHVGDHEILLDDAVRLGERARAEGIEAQTVVWPGMMHVFQNFAPFLPEARRANREIGAFIRSRVGGPAWRRAAAAARPPTRS
jgi:monoterpene epsilon-lactone hydrolase